MVHLRIVAPHGRADAAMDLLTLAIQRALYHRRRRRHMHEHGSVEAGLTESEPVGRGAPS